ncbi:3-hydroxyacyl-CoA dehydrogenase/enoyl-CoA hydratase family protein [Mucilaginibacter phyllosphaerae]|uniref:3-hydroxyacyl-CoA dehydrogenase n=1 Tax=Mucilaginibacter phyllosphaerae TaxID=1812349 RepID=A0A4Y8A643_9SPHI|nr:3-hydroxyacyl-CoA dehydrogenase/enoyl-CoA hydratase family protein [Mucilaginibacter phyllosphaerae]MBB3971134.1 3-hydroxyacyl-CoA dehydrogenase [Mucilaginibacter phyllosphaerae]TEW63863.1 3-hydroxyacyl-CoA dehydrogenase/enoyl-CoA hydratase family protein [Mucilaginibacter phyllosphaerae]GGH22678.1 3-hydroxyacyl-CoA dehydrogenase [Mucilaginibacter phyllosphaerae]
MNAKRVIKKVAVLGSGVMGSRIACHFANIGLQALLLDIVPKDAVAGARNKLVNDALAAALKSSPSPIYNKTLAKNITTGNFEDDMPKIAGYDWIIEVVVERLDIKKLVFDQVEKYRTPGTLITSNTSGIPIHLMAEGRSDDFKKHFCGSHFFNPPRYLKLLEIIPAADTLPEVTDFLLHFGEKYLGKTTVLAKDTPAFIGNRIGVFSIMSILHYADKTGISIEEVDKLTGPVIGHPKSATFRTSDVVGIDTMVHVANGLSQGVPDDEAGHLFQIPGFVTKMVANNWLGSKSGQGFYKKDKVNGANVFSTLDLKTLEYQPSKKVKFASLETTKTIESLSDRMKVLFAAKDKAGDFYRAIFYQLFAYSSNRIPEITNDLYKIDAAMNAGFGWETGPFEKWDALGVADTLKAMEADGHKPAQWVYDMLAAGASSFYKIEDGKRLYYDIPSKSYKIIPGTEEFILLDNIRAANTIWKNSGTTITDLGDGIINLEFHTKMNTIGGEVIEGINKAITLAEQNYKGLVISNEGANFSAGANVGMIFMMAVEQEFDELNMVIKAFQNTMMRIRYSSIPVIAAPHQMALGGGCELCLHADKVVAHAELYMGLVEFGVGLIPGGGGTKEFALRLSDELQDGDIEMNNFRDRFLTIGQAKVSTSAQEAFELGYLKKGRDMVVISRNRLLAEAKKQCLLLADEGYTQPVQRKDIRVLGKAALGLGYVGANTMFSGNYISEHDVKISQKLAYVMAGADLSQPTLVSEEYLLNLEREAFLQLCAERKTLERIQSILTGGKVLRN